MKKLLISLLIFIILSSVSYAVTTVDSCAYYIGTSGDYDMTSLLNCPTGDAIDIDVSNVLLDCKGNTINSSRASGTVGIQILNSGYTNITIQNCVIYEGRQGLTAYSPFTLINSTLKSDWDSGLTTTRRIHLADISGVRFIDVNMSNNRSDPINNMDFDMYLDSTNSNSIDNVFTNFVGLNESFIRWLGTNANSYSMRYTLSVQANYSNGTAVNGAYVFVNNVNRVETSSTISSTGLYQANFTAFDSSSPGDDVWGGGINTYYTPYTIAISLNPYSKLQTTTLTAPTTLSMTLSSTPTYISTCQNLQDMALNRNGNYKLIRNVDCSDTRNWNSGLGFIPIGSFSSSPFNGVFSGQGYNITNIYINRSAETYSGLFNYAVNATIKDVGLVNVNITGCTYPGALLSRGAASGTGKLIIYQVFSTGSINSICAVTSYAGGLIGYIGTGGNCIVNKTYSIASVRNSDGTAGGGLIGYLSGTSSSVSILTNSYSTGNVNSTSSSNIISGGLVGVIGTTTGFQYITNTYSIGNSVANSYAGGIVGRVVGSTTSSHINNSFVIGNVSGNYASGVGMIYGGTSTFTTSNNYYFNESNCTNLAGPCISSGTAIGPQSYFYNSSNAPMNTWDFISIWNSSGTSYPTLIFNGYSSDQPISPNITLNNPTNNSSFTSGVNNSITFNFTVLLGDGTVSNCSLWTNTSGSWAINQTLNSTIINNTVTNFNTINVSSGSYIWNTQCTDSYGTSVFATSNYTFSVQTAAVSPPNVTLITPINNTKTSQRLQTFTCNATSPTSISSTTLYIWNSSGNIINQNIINNYCYQESSNVSNQTGIDGSCNLNYSGSYNVTSSTPFVVTYKKPIGALSTSLWKISTNFAIENITIPSNCWTISENISFKVTQTSVGGYYGYNFECSPNTTDWTFIKHYNTTSNSFGAASGGVERLYDGNWGTACGWVGGWNCGGVTPAFNEESMYWSITVSNTTSFSKSINFTSGGVYNWNCLANDSIGQTAFAISNYTISLAPFINNSRYNVTSAYLNNTIWRNSTSYYPRSYDLTPTVETYIDSPGNCTISTFNYNYSTVKSLSTSYMCSTDNSKLQICTYPTNLPYGFNTLYIACSLSSSLVEMSNSTSGPLNISIDYYSNLNVSWYNQTPSDLTSTNAINTGINVTYSIRYNTTYESINYTYLYYQSGINGNCWTITNGNCTLNGYERLSYSPTINGNLYTWRLDDTEIYPATYPSNRLYAEERVNSFYNLDTANYWASQMIKNVSLVQYSFAEAMYNATATTGTGIGFVRICNISNPTTPETNTNCYTLAQPTKSDGWNHCHSSEGGNVCDKVWSLPINLTSNTIGTVKIPSNQTMYFIFRGTGGTGGDFQLAYSNQSGSNAYVSGNGGVAWTDFIAGTFLVHIHQYNGTEQFKYYANISTNASGGQNISSIRSDNLDVTILPPVPPQIITPTLGTYYSGIVPINYTAAIPFAGYSKINYYLINWSNGTLIYNNSLNLTYRWNVSNINSGNYTILVQAFDNASNSAWEYSEEFAIYNTFNSSAYNVTFPYANNYYLNNNTFTVNFSTTDIYYNNVVFNITGITNTSFTNITNTTIKTITYNNLQNGKYYYSLTIYDIAGNSKYYDPNITIDTIYPTIQFVSPTENNNTMWSRNWIYVNVSIVDVNYNSTNIYLWNTTGLVSTYSGNFTNFTGLSNGVYYINVSTTDLAGNYNRTETRIYTLDTVSPTVSIQSPTNTYYNTNSIWVNITVSDLNITNYEYCYQETATVATSCGGLATGAYSTSSWFTTVELNDGDWDTRAVCSYPNQCIMNINYTIPFLNSTAIWQVKYQTGETTPTLVNYTIPTSCYSGSKISLRVFDNRTPAEDKIRLQCLNSTSEWQTLNSLVQASYFWEEAIYWNVSTGNIDSIWFYNGSQNITWNNNVQFTMSEGVHNLIAYANDSVGNLGSSNVSFTIDTIYPRINFTYPTENTSTTWMRTWIYANVSIYDINYNNTVIKLYLSNVLVNTTNSNQTNFTSLAYGSYNLNVTACDLAGNCNSTETRTYSLISTPTPVILLDGVNANRTYEYQTTANITIQSTSLNQSICTSINYPGYGTNYVCDTTPYNILLNMGNTAITTFTNGLSYIDLVYRYFSTQYANIGLDNDYNVSSATIGLQGTASSYYITQLDDMTGTSKSYTIPTIVNMTLDKDMVLTYAVFTITGEQSIYNISVDMLNDGVIDYNFNGTIDQYNPKTIVFNYTLINNNISQSSETTTIPFSIYANVSDNGKNFTISDVRFIKTAITYPLDVEVDIGNDESSDMIFKGTMSGSRLYVNKDINDETTNNIVCSNTSCTEILNFELNKAEVYDTCYIYVQGSGLNSTFTEEYTSDDLIENNTLYRDSYFDEIRMSGETGSFINGQIVSKQLRTLDNVKSSLTLTSVGTVDSGATVTYYLSLDNGTTWTTATSGTTTYISPAGIYPRYKYVMVTNAAKTANAYIDYITIEDFGSYPKNVTVRVSNYTPLSYPYTFDSSVGLFKINFGCTNVNAFLADCDNLVCNIPLNVSFAGPGILNVNQFYFGGSLSTSNINTNDIIRYQVDSKTQRVNVTGNTTGINDGSSIYSYMNFSRYSAGKELKINVTGEYWR